jgi:hypothetical protein
VFKLDVNTGDTSKAVMLSDLLNRFTAYYVNVSPEVTGNSILPNGNYGVLYSMAKVSAPATFGTDVDPGTTVMRNPNPIVFKTANAAGPSSGRAAFNVHQLPTATVLGNNPLVIVNPMTSTTLLEI